MAAEASEVSFAVFLAESAQELAAAPVGQTY